MQNENRDDFMNEMNTLVKLYKNHPYKQKYTYLIVFEVTAIEYQTSSS